MIFKVTERHLPDTLTKPNGGVARHLLEYATLDQKTANQTADVVKTATNTTSNPKQ